MIRWKSLVLGAAVFVAAHIVQVAFWHDWFEPGGAYQPWFLNSGRAVAFTAVCLFVAGVLVGILSRAAPSESVIAGGNLALGALAAMGAVLAVTGPGTLFPIVLVFCAGVAAVSGIAGTLTGSALGTIGKGDS